MTALDLSQFHGQPWLDADISVIGGAAAVPTMLAEDEQLLYHWLTSHWAEGSGAVVDLGCFVGGSTARLAEGHRLAGLTSEIHAFDRFKISEGLKKQMIYPKGIARFEGDDALPLVAELLAPWEDRVTLRPGMIEDQTWDSGPIELLVMDASKNTGTTDAMAEIFFPSLIPGHSLVVQQDYLHWRQPWVPVQMQLMADCFTPVAYAQRDTMVFLCIKPVDGAALAAGKVDGMSDNELLNYLRQARDTYRAFGVQKRLKPAIEAIRASPGVRQAYKMKRV